ncbi:hypothetical protein [Nocardia vinacea]|uniref:hypothetical protein n=1 Tax=Nocardia vinacea TaxID=96468 RepID=UPI0012F6E75D|nr:hypothetical protein [Nocardia vinacea]
MKYRQQPRPAPFGHAPQFSTRSTQQTCPSWVQIALALGSLFVLAVIVATLYGTPSPLAETPRAVTVATPNTATPPGFTALSR